MEEKSVIIDAGSGTAGASLQISRFTDNFDTVKFRLDKRFKDYVMMIVAQVDGTSVIIENDGDRLSVADDSEGDGIFLVWNIGREITCMSGLVVYQIVAYRLNGESIESTWYSKEGRISVSESVDISSHSAAVIGSYPNLITRLILENDIIRNLIKETADSKVDKKDGYSLSENNFSKDEKEKLESIEYNAQKNVIEKIKIDGVPADIDETDKSANVSISEAVYKVISENREIRVIEDADISVLNTFCTPGEVYFLKTSYENAGGYAFLFVTGSYDDKTNITQILITDMESGDYSNLGVSGKDMIYYRNYEYESNLWTNFCSYRKSPVITEIPDVLLTNREYSFGKVDSVTLNFPDDENQTVCEGDVIYISFLSGADPTIINIYASSMTETEIESMAYTGYEIYAKYIGGMWVINHSYYSLLKSGSGEIGPTNPQPPPSQNPVVPLSEPDEAAMTE